MPEYILGIDCGNTAIKAAIFDLHGHEIGMASTRVETLFSKPGYSESNLNELWQSCTQVIRDALFKANLKGSDIKGIGCSGHGNGLYLFDENNASTIAIKSLDSRADDLSGDIKHWMNYDQIHALNHQGVWPSQTATLLKWVKINVPDVYYRSTTLLFCKDYINFKLSDTLATDFGDLSASGLFDFKSHNVSQQLLKFLDISEAADMIPPAFRSEQIIGTVQSDAAGETGLLEGTPVVAGMFDVVASAVGTGVFENGKASMIAGTWSINQVISDDLPTPDIFMSSVFPGDRYLAIESSATSASNLEWFVSEFFQAEKYAAPVLDRKVFDYCNELVQQVQLNENLPIYHPYLYGSKDNAHLGANFFGVSGWHTRADLLYAVYEGIVFGHQEHVDKLARFGITFDHVVLGGGGSRSNVWCQLFADILNITVNVTPCAETGARGVAMAAATGVGLFASFDDAVSSMRGDYQSFYPNKDVQLVLRNRQKKYQKIALFLSEW
jgi:L-xylulokinase